MSAYTHFTLIERGHRPRSQRAGQTPVLAVLLVAGADSVPPAPRGQPAVISHTTIYRAIHAGRFNDPDWVKSGKQRLRHRGKTRRRKDEREH